MSGRTVDILQTFPARPLRPDERELVDEWAAAAGDVSSAFVSERRTDDPAMFRRIAIAADGNGAFTHLIHAPFHQDVWVVLNVRLRPEIHQFETLLEALNFVRPVLSWSPAWPGEQRADQQLQRDPRAEAAPETDRRRVHRPQFSAAQVE